MSSELFCQRQGGALPFLHWRARRSAREFVLGARWAGFGQNTGRSSRVFAPAFFRLLALSRTSEGLCRLLALSRTSAVGAVSLECPSEIRPISTCLCQVFSGASVDRCRCETGSPMKWMRSLSVRCSLLARCRVERSRESAIRSCTPQLFVHHVFSSKWRVKESRVR